MAQFIGPEQTAQAKAERMIAEEFGRPGWVEKDMKVRLKKNPVKLALAARLRKETTLLVKQIAERLSLGSWKSANSNLHHWANQHPNRAHGQTRV